jgi:polyhydroxybutyrate depolymerase
MRFIAPLLFVGSLSLCSFEIPAQVTTDSILVDGHFRAFHFNKPSNSKPGSSLIFVLHGSGGDGISLMSRTKNFIQQVAKEDVLLVYPDGYKKYWNECRLAANSQANLENINEEAFFNSMIQYFKIKFSVNEKRVFAIGTSGGGHMCYKLAMTMPGTFRAVTALIANLPDTNNLDCTEAKVAIPIMIVNGTADPLNPYNGGMMQSGNFIMGNVRSTDRSFQYWASLAGYKGEPTKTLIPDNDPTDGKTIERFTYRKKGKPEVVLLKVIGGKHDYPNDIDVHVEAWTFFKRQF